LNLPLDYAQSDLLATFVILKLIDLARY
jgi:hypothetical protein